MGCACRYCRSQSETAVKSASGTRQVASSSSAGRSRLHMRRLVPSSHCTCTSQQSSNSYTCPEGKTHDGSCFCKPSATECGTVDASGYNAYLASVRSGHPNNMYTARFSYTDLALDQEGSGYTLRVCLKHTHASQRKRVCVDSQKFAVLPDAPACWHSQ